MGYNTNINEKKPSSNDINNSGNNTSPCLPMITDYVTHVVYPEGCKIQIGEDSLRTYCDARWIAGKENDRDDDNKYINFIEVKSIPASRCKDARLSGAKREHRVYDPGALVRTLRKIAAA